MIIFNKKRLAILACAIILGIGIPMFSIINTPSIETMAIPVTNKTIILDAGHGTPDEGASSANGVTESSINLAITLKLKKLLENVGVNVILTRSDENGIYESSAKSIREKKVSDLKKRVEIGNNSDASMFISIHLNKINESQYYGWQSFFKKSSEDSERLAKSIQNKLNETIQRNNKREALVLNDVYIIEHVKVPISIIECGFLSNPEEEKLLQTDEYQNQLALGIFMGIVEYFSVDNSTENEALG